MIYWVLIYIIIGILVRNCKGNDGSVCFNNCNNHGECIDYSCHCYIGYHGDDCKVTFVSDELLNEYNGRIIPILGVGDYNVSQKQLNSLTKQNKFTLVGFSSYSCYKCIQYEYEYEKIYKASKENENIKNIPFVRANIDEMKSLATEYSLELPALVLFKKQKPLVYKGVHRVQSVITYIEKQVNKSTSILKSEKDIENFIRLKTSDNTLSNIIVIGFFADHDGIEEDDYNDYIEATKELQSKEDVHFGVVLTESLANKYKKNKIIDRTPSMMILCDNGITKSVNLDELYDVSGGIVGWINMNSVPLVGKMTVYNFRMYEKLSHPILMLFLDLTNEFNSVEPGKVVGGKSGGILNEILIQEFKEVAKEHFEKISFVYLDGNKHEDQMKSLGLYGGKERLPSIAFNTKEGLQVPFPEELAINKDTLMQFVANFLSGKLKSIQDTKEMAKKALQSTIPLSTKNKAQRKEKKSAPESVQGVSEQFGDGSTGDDNIVVITSENFENYMNDDKDVVILFHASNCEPCAHFSVYYKRMARRFHELNIPTLVIARMDVTSDAPPAKYNFLSTDLPILVVLPGGNKYPPWNTYSGVGKMQAMMKWIHSSVTNEFELENLPHLNEENKKLYKKQVREREEYIAVSGQ